MPSILRGRAPDPQGSDARPFVVIAVPRW